MTRSAIVPALAGDRLRAALALSYGLHQVAAVVGPALGGLMIAAFGVGAAYAAQAVGFVVMLGVTVDAAPAPAGADGRRAPADPAVDRGGPARSCAATAR